MKSPETLREMGRIVRPHGLMGELKVAPETDDPERFQLLKTIYVGADEASTSSFDILSVRLQTSKYGITVLLELVGITSREAAEKLNKLRVFADEQDLPPLEEGEFYFSELVGLSVSTKEDSDLGTVIDVIEGKGQNIMLIRKQSGGEVMIPMVEEFIVELDLKSRHVVIDPVEGLL